MDHIIAFSFCPGQSLLHRLDVRLKFFLICLISIAMISAGIIPVMVYFIVLCCLFFNAGINGFASVLKMKLFILLLVFVFVSRALATPGDALIDVYGITVTRQGVFEGGLVACKFFMVMMTGILFAATTRPASVKHAVQWFLKPVPFVPEKRVAVIISLSLSFMPQILKMRARILDAQVSRCAQLNRNPVKKMILQILPMLKKSFLCADQMIQAMEARCFSDDRTDPEFSASGNERSFLLGGILVAILLIIF